MGSWFKSFGAAVGAAALGALLHYTGVTDPAGYLSGLLGTVLTAVVGAVVSSVIHVGTPAPAPPATPAK